MSRLLLKLKTSTYNFQFIQKSGANYDLIIDEEEVFNVISDKSLYLPSTADENYIKYKYINMFQILGRTFDVNEVKINSSNVIKDKIRELFSTSTVVISGVNLIIQDRNFTGNIREEIDLLINLIVDISDGGNLIHKITFLNSIHMMYYIDCITKCFKNVYIHESLFSNTVDDEFYLICSDKISNPLLPSISEIPFSYNPINYDKYTLFIIIHNSVKNEISRIIRSTYKLVMETNPKMFNDKEFIKLMLNKVPEYSNFINQII